MKIEIAESLASSYLNHIEGCRVCPESIKDPKEKGKGGEL